MGEHEGKVAVVTGGSKGIGKACAMALAREGAEVMLLASDAGRLAAAALEIADMTGRRVETHAADLRTQEGCKAAFAATRQAFGRCNMLINSAGATKGGIWPDQPDDDYVDGFALKFYAAVRLCRLFWPSLKESQGTVINIVGSFARTPAPDYLVGGAVNAALANFSKGLAGAGLRDDVNVNWVHPGLTVTERLDEIFARKAVQQGKTPDEVQAESVASEGIRRLGEADDVANLVAFLCSAKARHIHGTGIQIDGGGTKGCF